MKKRVKAKKEIEVSVGKMEDGSEVEVMEEIPFKDMIFHSMVTGCMARGLTEDESIEWATLFKIGEDIREKARAEKMVEGERKRFLSYGGDYKGKKRGKKEGVYMMSLEEPSIEVMRWYLNRNMGVTPAECSAASGAKWNQVVNETQRNEELRCVRDGVLANLRQLTREISYGVALELLNGEDVNKHRTDMAKWVLERVDVSGTFKNPKLLMVEESRNSAQKAASQGGGGGIVINLIGDAVNKISSDRAKMDTGKGKVFTDI